MCKVVQLASVVCVNVQDLGSSLRSALSQYYFYMYVYMQLQRCGSPYAFQNPTSTCPWRSDQRLRIDEHPKLESTCQHVSKKVHQAMLKWAKLLKDYTSILGSEPPWFAIFSLSLCFYFFYYFLLIIVFN